MEIVRIALSLAFMAVGLNSCSCTNELKEVKDQDNGKTNASSLLSETPNPK